MDPVRIGAFLKRLRKERNMTQEAIAGKFGVTQRSVSRWENGTTMPDISVLIELADFYDVDIRDLLRGERESENMEEDLKETLEMVADYTEADKEKILKRVYVCGQGMLIVSVAAFIMYFVSYFVEGVFLTPLILILVGGFFAINTLLASLQLKGRMSKERKKKLLRISIIIWAALALIIIIFLTFVLPGIMVKVFDLPSMLPNIIILLD